MLVGGDYKNHSQILTVLDFLKCKDWNTLQNLEEYG